MSERQEMVDKIKQQHDTIRRQDEAIDEGLKVFARIARTGSCPKGMRLEAEERLKLARNERIPAGRADTEEGGR